MSVVYEAWWVIPRAGDVVRHWSTDRCGEVMVVIGDVCVVRINGRDEVMSSADIIAVLSEDP